MSGLRAVVVWSLAAFIAGAQKPMTYLYFYDDINQLTKVIDSDGNVVEYIYDEVGNMLEVRSSTITGTLALHHFSPQSGGIGSRVTLQGSGFSSVLTGNEVRFNGTLAKVLSASATSIVAEVPPGASSGPIAVTVGGSTVSSSAPFTVLATPVISRLGSSFVIKAATVGGFNVHGHNLSGATFTILPAFSPPIIAVTASQVAGDGRSATLSMALTPNIQGSFVVIATGPTGVSDAMPSPANTFTILASGVTDEDRDELSNAEEISRGTNPFLLDTDGDGFTDGFEVVVGTNPLDAESTPTLASFPPSSREGLSPVMAILNAQEPAYTGPPLQREALHRPFAALNHGQPLLSLPGGGGLTREVIGPPISIRNESPPQGVFISPNLEIDSDRDGLSDDREAQLGTSMFNRDSDGDGFWDGEEDFFGTSPLDPSSKPSFPPLHLPGESITPPIGIKNEHL